MAVGVALASLLAAGGAQAATYNNSTDRAYSSNVNIEGGFKRLNSDWKPADDQGAFGIAGDYRRTSWPVNVLASYTWARSSKENVSLPGGGTVQVQSQTDELDLGLRKYFERFERWRPFLSGGAALMDGQIKSTGPGGSGKNSDSVVGFFASVGAVYTIGDFVNLGAEVKYSKGDVDLGGSTFNAGGVLADVLVGIHY